MKSCVNRCGEAENVICVAPCGFWTPFASLCGRRARAAAFVMACAFALVFAARGFAADEIRFPSTRPSGASFSRPAESESVTVTPPGFSWWRAADRGKVRYQMAIHGDKGEQVYQSPVLEDPVHVPDQILPAGRYSWTVRAVDAQGKVLDTFGPRHFSIAEDAYKQPWVAPEHLLARIDDAHPRLLFPKRQLQEIRSTLTTTRREAFAGLKGAADRALTMDVPPEPDYDKIKDPAKRRLAYVASFQEMRRYHLGGMQHAALMYIMTGDAKYGLAAKRLLLGATEWDPEGISSIMAPYGDEVGLGLVKSEALTYDWIYDLCEAAERKRIEQMIVARADQMLRRLERRDFLARPESSHDGRLPGYLIEHAIVLKDHPRAAVWLDYALRSIMTVFPHWGGSDGGWAEGLAYGTAYNGIFVTPFESLRIATGMDLWQRPYFRKMRYFFVYNISPRGDIFGFGDSYDRPSRDRASSIRGLLQFHAERFQDPVVRGWLELFREDGRSLPGLPPLPGLIFPQTVQPKLPIDLPNDAVFRGVGWAALHSDIADPDNDLFIAFKSSPYGPVSHSYADQNGFAIMKGGRALARPGGSRYPQHGSPFHTRYTQQTMAQCSILVDGKGQRNRDGTANGHIVDFRTSKNFGYVCGDATAAYAGLLKRFRRHVLLVRPSVVCIVDELEAPKPARYQWLMHAFHKLELDEAQQQFVSRRGDASMDVIMTCPVELAFSQTNEWPLDPKTGFPTAQSPEPAKLWHFKAETDEPQKKIRIATLVVVKDADERPRWHKEASEPSATSWVVESTGEPVRLRVNLDADAPANEPIIEAVVGSSGDASSRFTVVSTH